MPDDEHVLAITLELLHQRVQACDDVQVALTARIAVRELILSSQLVFAWICGANFFVRHTVADAGVNLVEISQHARSHLDPIFTTACFHFVVLEMTRSELGALQRRRPKPHRSCFAAVWITGNHSVSEIREFLRVRLAHRSESRVTTDFTVRIIFALPVSR